MKRSTRVRVTALLSGAFLVLLSMMTQSTASAAAANNPTCWADILHPNGAAAACETLAWGERVRAVVKCDGFWSDYYRHGAWQSRSSDQSHIYCDSSGDDRLGHWYETVIDTWSSGSPVPATKMRLTA